MPSRWQKAVLVAALVALPACGSKATTATSARSVVITIEHRDYSTLQPYEGAVSLLTVRDRTGATVYEGPAVYPLPTGPPPGVRDYVLKRDLSLPTGHYTLEVQVRACPAACGNIATVAAADQQHYTRDDTPCRVDLQVTPATKRAIVVDRPGTPCQVATT